MIASKIKLILETEIRPPVPVGVVKEIYNKIKEITGIKFPNVIFKQNQVKHIDGPDEFRFTYSYDIIVLEGYKVIPNFSKVVEVFNKYFGNVYTKSDMYINARAYGQPKEIDFVKIKKSLNELPKANDILKGKKVNKETIDNIITKLNERKADTTGRPKFRVIYKTKISGYEYKILEWNNTHFLTDNLNIYQLKNIDEYHNVAKLLTLVLLWHRHKEIQSWEGQDMSNPLG